MTYLKRGIGISIGLRASDTILEYMDKMRGGNVPVYGLIRDIVSDIRFYNVTENDEFWRPYCLHHVSQFFDSLTEDDLADEEILTGKKEDFLNKWFVSHLLGLNDEEKKEKLSAISRGKGSGGSSNDEYSQEEDEGAEGASKPNKIDDRIYDCSNVGGKNSDSLPDDLKDYQHESSRENDNDTVEGPIHGYGKGESHTAEARYLKNIDPSIVRLAEMIGRSGEYDIETSGKFLHSGKSDISGVTVGNDLNSILPSELVILADKRTENIFFQKYTQNRLQTFASASHSIRKGEKKCGPIFICLDTSSSMQGAPEIMAKTLALAVAIVAQRKHRPVILFNYSFTVSFFVLQNLKRQKDKLLKFLSTSYAGGNDENILFRFALKGIFELPKYEKSLKIFDGADFLVVSDFQWGHISQDIRRLLDENRQQGIRFYGLSVNEYLPLYNNKECNDSFEDCQDGYDFLRKCDKQFTYDYRDGLNQI